MSQQVNKKLKKTTTLNSSPSPAKKSNLSKQVLKPLSSSVISSSNKTTHKSPTKQNGKFKPLNSSQKSKDSQFKTNPPFNNKSSLYKSKKNEAVIKSITLVDEDVELRAELDSLKLCFIDSSNNPLPNENEKYMNPNDYTTIQMKMRERESTKKEFDVDFHLLCHVCKHLLLNDPVECYKCSTRFCRKCLFDLYEIYHRCPKCFEIIGGSLIKSVDMTEEYSNTYLDCPNVGCKDRVNLLNIRNHIAKCDFKGSNVQQIVQINKFTKTTFEKDHYVKMHILDFIKQLNVYSIQSFNPYLYSQEELSNADTSDNEGNNNNNNINKNQKKDMCKEDVELNDIHKKIEETNVSIEKDILDIANATKSTNDKIKRMMNKMK